MAKKPAPLKDRFNKTQILDQIAASTALSRKQVAAVLDSLADVLEAHINKKAVGEFVLPGLMKISTVRKAGGQGTQGHQSIHQGRGHVQSQARLHGRQSAPAEEAQGHGALRTRFRPRFAASD